MHGGDIASGGGLAQQSCRRTGIVSVSLSVEQKRAQIKFRQWIMQACALPIPLLGDGHVLRDTDSEGVEVPEIASCQPAAASGGLIQELDGHVFILWHSGRPQVRHAEADLGLKRAAGRCELIPVRGAHGVFRNANSGCVEVADLQFRLRLSGSGRLLVPIGRELEILRNAASG